MTTQTVKTLISHVCCADEFAPAARSVVITLTESDVKRIRFLAALAKEHGIADMSDHTESAYWSEGDYHGEIEDGASHEAAMATLENSVYTVRGKLLVVRENGFWVEAYSHDEVSGPLESVLFPLEFLDNDEPYQVLLTYC